MLKVRAIGRYDLESFCDLNYDTVTVAHHPDKNDWWQRLDNDIPFSWCYTFVIRSKNKDFIELLVNPKDDGT